jgi:hypothetical protein
MRKIEMIAERTNTGYSAYASKYAVYTTGRDLNKLKSNMVEALNLYFEDESKTVTENDIKISLDRNNFLSFIKS